MSYFFRFVEKEAAGERIYRIKTVHLMDTFALLDLKKPTDKYYKKTFPIKEYVYFILP